MITTRIRTDYAGMVAAEGILAKGLENGLKSLAEAIVRDVDSNWSSVSPSMRGGPPAVVTGTLRRSVRIEARDALGRFTSVGGGNVISMAIRYGAPYAGILENGPLERPFLDPAVERQGAIAGMYFGRVM